MDKDSQVLKKIKRSNLTTIIFSVIGLASVVVLAYLFSLPYWMAQITGPIEITAEEILALDGSERLYNRAVSGIDMDDTYQTEVTYNENGQLISTDAYFGALEIEKDVWVLVRAPEEINMRQEDYVGTFQPISDSVALEVFDVASDDMDIEFLPIMLDVTKNEIMWYVGTAALAIVGLASLWGIFAFLQRSSNPASHPILKKLGRFGNVEDIVHSIDKDLTMGEDKVGKLSLTKSYLVNANGNNFEAMPYNAVAWVYKMVKSGKYGKTYEAHIYDVTGYMMVIIANENDVNAMLQAVAGRAPWALAGFSDDIKRTWNKDRQTLIAEVENRRRQAGGQR